MAQVWDDAPYEGAQLLVLLALADHANDQGKCWPSIQTIARKARCKERWTQTTITQFIRDGWVVREERPGTTNLYTVTPPSLSGGAVSAGVQSSAPHPGTPMHPGGAAQDTQNHQGTTNEPSDGDGALRLTNPEPPKQRPKRSWEPHPAARERAESLAHVLDVDIHIDRYIARCRERERRPNNDEWLRWFFDDEQRARTELKAQLVSTEPAEDDTGTPRSWRSR